MTTEKNGTSGASAVRMLVGLLLSAALGALAFEMLSRILAPSSPDRASSTVDASSYAFVGIWLFDAFFVLALAAIVGLPIAWVAKRFRMANAFTAGAVGLIVGLAISLIYGGADMRSPASVVFMLGTFGIPGAIAGLTFWAVVKNLFR
jgi:hypothetical protein